MSPILSVKIIVSKVVTSKVVTSKVVTSKVFITIAVQLTVQPPALIPLPLVMFTFCIYSPGPNVTKLFTFVIYKSSL